MVTFRIGRKNKVSRVKSGGVVQAMLEEKLYSRFTFKFW